MGAEETRVILFTKSKTATEVRRALLDLATERTVEKPGSDAGYQQLLLDGGSYIIEAEIGGAPIRLTLRFALCNPEAVEEAFIRLIERASLTLQADVHVVGASKPFATVFSPPGLDGVREAIAENVRAERILWEAEFGVEKVKATCEDAVQLLTTRRRPT